MPWKEVNTMDERIKFVARHLGDECTVTELCRAFGISRKTGYKWIERYQVGGASALVERSRAPHSHPNALSPAIKRLILEARARRPNWGPRKLKVVLERRHPSADIPAASTIGRVLKSEGLIKPKARRRRSAPHGVPLVEYSHPNAVWCADFKGHFPIAGSRCLPLTITDGYSRKILTCKAMKSSVTAPVMKVFERAFREFGLPEVIRTDNGAPFSSLAPAGLSQLAVWWIKLNITPERILPGRPDQNGRHERMHRTLKRETASPPRSSFQAQQAAFDRFVRDFNQLRPHEGLGMDVPDEHYRASQRSYPSRVPDVEYPEHMVVTKAYPNGIISHEGTQWYISGCLGNEMIGLEPTSTDTWKVYFGPKLLGVVDPRRERRRKCRSFGELIRSDGELTGRRRGKRRRR
jgi:transposase InsO family protein